MNDLMEMLRSLGIQAERCDCAVCRVAWRYADEGVPELVIMAFCNLLSAASDETEPTVEDRARMLEERLVTWQRVQAAAHTMTMLGLVTDAEFQEAVESPDPTVSMNLYTRLLDFSKRQTH